MNRGRRFFAASILLFLGVGMLASMAYILLGNITLFQPTNQALPTVKPQTLATLAPFTPTATPVAKKPGFETGMVTPQWSPGGYGNAAWDAEISAMQLQTNARWIEMPIEFEQPFHNSEVVDTKTAPLPVNFEQGVLSAKKLGLHVFVVPHLDVRTDTNAWSGTIKFDSRVGMQLWFNAYFAAWKPYLVAAQTAGADQLSIGTEIQWMQYHAPASMWKHFIDQVSSLYHGKLTYDTNWTSDPIPTPPSWWSYSKLSAIGISLYRSLENSQKLMTPAEYASGFKSQAKKYLDAYAQMLSKPLIVTEIGYRDDSYPGFNPWDSGVKRAPNQEQQAMAYSTALKILLSDPYIHGVFPWGWSNTGLFDIKNTQAAAAIHAQYSSNAF
jgi:hypothetical protein